MIMLCGSMKSLVSNVVGYKPFTNSIRMITTVDLQTLAANFPN
jgi:hypothetical protein